MKRLFALLVCICLVLGTASACAESIKLGKAITLDGSCEFAVNSVKVYDRFLNQESGSSKQFVVVSFDLLNLRVDEQFYTKAETDAKLTYDGDFEFPATYLWNSPVGAYYRAASNQYLFIVAMDEHGVPSIQHDSKMPSSWGKTYEDAWVKWNYQYNYNPIEDAYLYQGNKTDEQYWRHGESKTVLNPLVERTYYYVFHVPDIVAEEEGMRELILTVDDEEYTLRF